MTPHPSTTPDPFAWLPEPEPRRFRLYPGEKAVMRAQVQKSVAEWAQGERYIHVSPLPGPMDLDNTPYLHGLMDLYSLEHVRELFVAGGSQSAKTDLMHTCWGERAVQDPGPALVVMQDRVTGSETVTDRLHPMIEDTPSLRRLKSKNPDHITAGRIRLKNGMITYLGWAQSEGRLASKPVRYGFFDEVDLWPESAIRKARARLRAFEDSYKVIEACTASTENGRIWSARKLAQVTLEFHAVCPHCQHEQTMDFAQVRWPEEAVDPADLSEKGSAWYECIECRQKWDEEDRNEAVRLGRDQHDPPHVWRGWRDTSGREIRNPSRIWAHIPPLISRFVPFHKIAQAYLLTLVEPTEANLQYFYNDCLGRPVPEDSEGEAVQEKDLYTRRETYAPQGADWQIPMAAVVLTADADVQANRIELEVVAWGPGHESWGIEYKTFFGKPQEQKVWDDLHEWAERARYRHESGVDLAIARLGIDIGYATDHVSKFVKRSRRYIAHKGSNTRGLPLVPRKPSKTRKYKVPFYELGTEAGKDTVMTWLGIEEPGPRFSHFPETYDFEYFRMLCSERPVKEKDKRTGKLVTVWKLREGFVRNEALDIRVGNLAVREILNPNYEKLGRYLREQARKLSSEPESETVSAIREKVMERLQDLPEEKRAAAEKKLAEVLPQPEAIGAPKRRRAKVKRTGNGFVNRNRRW